MAVILTDLKAEVRVTHSHEDTLLQRKLDAATIFVESRIGKSFDDFEDGVPAATAHANERDIEPVVGRLAGLSSKDRGESDRRDGRD